MPRPGDEASQQVVIVRNIPDGSCSKSYKALIRIIVVCVVSLVLCGYLQALNGGLFLIPSFMEKFFPHHVVQSDGDTYCMFNDSLLILYATSLYVLGLISSALWAYFTRYGHMASILCGAVLVDVGALLEICSLYGDWAPTSMLLIARILPPGLGYGILKQAASSYLAEMAPANRRVCFALLDLISMKIGALFPNLINLLIILHGEHLGDYGWVISSALVPLMFTVILKIIGVWIWLFSTEDALHKRETGDVGADEEATSFFGSLMLLRAKRHREAVFTGILILIITLVAANMIGTITYRAIGFNHVMALIIESSRILASCVGIAVVMGFVDKMNRVVWFMLGGCFMLISLVVLCIAEKYAPRGDSLHDALCFGAIIVYEIGSGVLWGSVGVVMKSETVYPSKIRSLGEGMLTLTSFIFPALTSGSNPLQLCNFKYWIFLSLALAVFAATALAVKAVSSQSRECECEQGTPARANTEKPALEEISIGDQQLASTSFSSTAMTSNASSSFSFIRSRL